MIDVADLYAMIRQTEGGLSLKKMLEWLKLTQAGGRSRFVMKNNYFPCNNQFYHQIRGGVMRSPLTLIIGNCHMFFFERNIYKHVHNSGGLYFRFIHDIFIIIDWPHRHLMNFILYHSQAFIQCR
jgi:hypothetical protein